MNIDLCYSFKTSVDMAPDGLEVKFRITPYALRVFADLLEKYGMEELSLKPTSLELHVGWVETDEVFFETRVPSSRRPLRAVI